MDWIVYILRSLRDNNKIYIGSTSNVHKRLEDHNRGGTRSTKPFLPWVVAYVENYKTKKEAVQRERQLKKWKNRGRIENLIKRKTRC